LFFFLEVSQWLPDFAAYIHPPSSLLPSSFSLLRALPKWHVL